MRDDNRFKFSMLLLLVCLLVGTPLLASALVPRVLYESERVLAIHKPPGISHHNDDATGELGIVSQLRLHYNSENDNMRLYGVHRLDRVTSGILLFAKDAEMASILSAAFKEAQVIKYYVGISNRKPKKKKQGWIKGDMVRGRRKSWYLTREEKDKSNFAVTRFFSAGLGGLDKHRLPTKEEESQSPSTCLLFRPHTGKTHQLRVAAKSVGLPLLGDPIYGDSGSDSRTFLHAAAIHLPLEDEEHEPVTIWCPPPFADLLWEESGNDSFDHILENLFQKHCESPEILSLISQVSQ